MSLNLEKLMETSNEEVPFIPITSSIFNTLNYEQSVVDSHQRLYNLIYDDVSAKCLSLCGAEVRDVAKRRMVSSLYKFLDTVKK